MLLEERLFRIFKWLHESTQLFLILKTSTSFMSQWANTGEATFHLAHHSKATVVWAVRVSAQNTTDEEDTPNIPTRLSASIPRGAKHQLALHWTLMQQNLHCVTGSSHNTCWDLQVWVQPADYRKLVHIHAELTEDAIISTRKRQYVSKVTRCGFSQSTGTLSTKLWL